MHMRAKYFVITSSSTWTSTVTLMARAYGFSISDIFVIDLNDKANRLAGLAKTGCYS
jgi:shikimate kinase